MFSRTALVAAVLVVATLGMVPTTPAAGLSAPQEQACEFPITRTDATGTDVTVAAEPDRVVVLQASAAQVMWEIGAREKVVGMPVAPYTAYLNGSATKMNVANPDGTPNREKIVNATPDLVLAPNVIRNETVDQIRGDGLTVYKAGFGRSLADISAKTQLFGRLVGRCEAATRTVTAMTDRIESIRRTVDGETRPRVLYTFYNFTVTEGTFIHEVIETAGGDNVAANVSSSGYPELNEEVVVQRDPEWVVVPSGAPLPGGEAYESTTAYRHNQTLVVDENYLSQPGPRVVQPMAKMARSFHPAAFANATETPPPTTTRTATDLPGFGPVVAFVALVALVAGTVARRTRRF